MAKIELTPSDYKILVVDDITTNVLLLKAVLGKAKYNIITAGGGIEALSKVKAELPDLILLDVMMPDLDGHEVIRRLKNDPEYAECQHIPVIFLTALQNPEDIVKGFKLGASDYVAKPFNHEELITRVAHHIFIASAERTITRQRDELRVSMESRDKMYSVIAHDLRSPVGTIKMIFNMLLVSTSAKEIGEENFEMLTMGNDITENTFMLLDNLLKWTKSQTGRMNTVFQDADLSEVVLFASKTQELVAQVKNVEIEFDIPHPVPVQCDVDMIKTIMRNLLSNAIKYSSEGCKITISVEQTDTHGIVHVRDNGQGIKEEDIPKLLNPDVHFTTYGTKNEEGSGLGLQLVQDLVSRNGGEVSIESKLGEGSVFTFTVSKHQKEQDRHEDNS